LRAGNGVEVVVRHIELEKAELERAELEKTELEKLGK
jgi:hypothetical protein